VGVAPAVDRFAIDQFHREPGLGTRGDAAIEQGGDVRMLQLRQDLALAQEALARRPGIGAGADQLDRGLLAVGAVAALRGVDRAHAAAADDAEYGPGAKVAAQQAIALGLFCSQCRAPAGCCGERFCGLRIGGQQRPHLRQQGRVIPAQRQQPLFPHVAVELGHFVEHGQRALAAGGVAHACISASRNARALRQSRRRVRSLMPSMSAISVSE